MSQAFLAKQGDQVFEGYFAQPAFGLFRDLPGLLTEVFQRLRGYGLTLSAMQSHLGPALGEAHVRCDLPNSVIRIFLDRITITSDLALGSKEHDRRRQSAMEALSVYVPEIAFGSYTLVLQLHGELPGSRPEQVLARIAAVAPTTLGPLLTAGAVFYYGADADRLSSSLNLEPSVLVSEGLFLRARAIYDASRHNADGVSEATLLYLRSALSEFDLVLEGWK